MANRNPNTRSQIGDYSRPDEYRPLYDEWRLIHMQLARTGLWKWDDLATRRVSWTPWRCWDQVGYGTNKLKQLMKWYLIPGRLSKTAVLINQACLRNEWSSVALPLGLYENAPGSPLRYKLGQCMQLVVFKFHPMVGLVPQVTWRTAEPTRRLIADWVVLDNVFAYIRKTTGLAVHHVELNLNILWLANFNAPLAEAWMPGLIDVVPKYRKRFLVTQTPPQYRARKYAWDLVKGATPMFPGLKEGKLHDEMMQSDWPKLKKELIV